MMGRPKQKLDRIVAKATTPLLYSLFSAFAYFDFSIKKFFCKKKNAYWHSFMKKTQIKDINYGVYVRIHKQVFRQKSI